MRVFDRDLKVLHRDRAALGDDRHAHDMLRDEIADRLTGTPENPLSPRIIGLPL